MVSKALKSGNYKQGIGCLEQLGEDGNVFNCCLGVACREYIKSGGLLQTLSKENSYIPSLNNSYKTVTWFNEHAYILPREVCDWLGINATGGMTDGNSLSSMNDSGKNFHEIANVLENGTFRKIKDEKLF